MSILPYIMQELLGPTRMVLRRAPRLGRDWMAVEEDFWNRSTVHSDGKEFKINFDVQDFKPEDLKISVEGDKVTVDAKHEDRSYGRGFISRQFSTTYTLPEGVDVKTLVSSLTSDGVLSIKAPFNAPTESSTTKEIPISFKTKTGGDE